MWPSHDQQLSGWLQKTATRCIAADRRWALSLQRAADWPAVPVLPLLIAVSWLGDGALWYASVIALPLFDGWAGWPCALQILCLGAINLVIYFCLKHGIGRRRPYVDCPDIRACARALDRFSFPSGHTLHAVSYALVISSHYPGLALPLWTFAVLVGVSRVALGLHYPSDVLVGALVGAATASVVLAWP